MATFTKFYELTATPGTWVVPEDVTSVTAEAIGGGGGGGARAGGEGAGGGGGYAIGSSLTVTAGGTYTLQVGSASPVGAHVTAGSSYFINTTTVFAHGGTSGSAGGAGTGGAAGVGTPTFAGGNGGTGAARGGGGGGGAAANSGIGGAGAPGTTTSGGAGGTSGTAVGGHGGNSTTSGTAGSVPGGGGGGGGTLGNSAAGQHGIVNLTFTSTKFPLLEQSVTNFPLVGTLTELAGTLPGNVTQGNVLIAAFNVFLGTITSFTDSRSNTWVPIGTAINGEDRTYLYYVGSAAGGSTIATVVIDSDHSMALGIYEYSGLAAGTPLQATTNGSTLTSVNVNPGTLTTTQNNELIVSVGGDFVALGTFPVSRADEFTLRHQQNDTNGQRYYFQDQVLSRAGTVSGSFTLQNAAATRAIQASFYQKVYPAESPSSIFGFKTLLGVGQA